MPQMQKFFGISIVIFSLVLLTACSGPTSSPAALSPDFANTDLPLPSATFTAAAPTPTSVPSDTPLPVPPTATASATATQTATPEPTKEPTAASTPTAHPNSIIQFLPEIKPASLMVSSRGEKLVLVKDSQFTVLQKTDGSLLASFEVNNRVTAYALSPDGSRLAVAVTADEPAAADIQIFETTTGELIASIQPAHPSQVQVLKFSPDGLLILSASQDQSVKIWDFMNNTLVQTIPAHTSQITCMAVSPDGKHIVTGSIGTDKNIFVWSSDGQQADRLTQNNTHCYGASFSPDNRWVLTYTGDKRTLYRVSGWEREWQEDFSQASTPFIGFTPDGLIYLGNRQGHLDLIDPASQAVTSSLELGPVVSFEFSPATSEIVVVRHNGVVEILKF
jgi:WD40 repeat protein